MTIVNSVVMLNCIKHLIQGTEIQQMVIKELKHCLIAVFVWMHHWNQVLQQGEQNTFRTPWEVMSRDLKEKEKVGITCHWKIPTSTYMQTW